MCSILSFISALFLSFCVLTLKYSSVYLSDRALLLFLRFMQFPVQWHIFKLYLSYFPHISKLSASICRFFIFSLFPLHRRAIRQYYINDSTSVTNFRNSCKRGLCDNILPFNLLLRYFYLGMPSNVFLLSRKVKHLLLFRRFAVDCFITERWSCICFLNPNCNFSNCYSCTVFSFSVLLHFSALYEVCI